MAVMKKDVNIGLLILIIASIILFSGFSVYYQTTFKDVSLEYKEKLEQLSDVTKELGTKRQELNETYSLRVKAETDREALDAKYKDASDENEGLRTDNTNLRSEVSSTKSELGEKSAQLDATKNLLAQTQASLSSAQGEVTSLKSQKSNLKDDVERICVKLVAAGDSDDDC
jgi:chromosome segregation ATPase|tara:strand:+ start:1677 stop:2189 length:513 start_codon:yes stop_codon:yes gene_type:complete